MSTTTERLIRLVEKGEMSSQACAARALGVSREYVRQIVNKEGLKLGRRQQKNTLIEWPCPECGKPVRMWTRNRSYRKTAYCGSCRSSRFGGGVPKDYCHRGHLMAETRRRHPNGDTYCLLCNRMDAREHYWRNKARA